LMKYCIRKWRKIKHVQHFTATYSKWYNGRKRKDK